MKAYRYEQNEIQSILKRIEHRLIQQVDTQQSSYLELEEDDQSLVLKFKTKKTSDEKQAILNELAGSGLRHGQDFLEDALRTASREGEEDRVGFNLG